MKKIKLILVSLFAVAMTLSCDDDGGDSKINVQEGAIPNIQKVEGSESFINLSELQAGMIFYISRPFIARGLKHVASLMLCFYINADVQLKGIQQQLTTFPAVVLIKMKPLRILYTLDTVIILHWRRIKNITDITLKMAHTETFKNDITQNYCADTNLTITPPIK